MKNMSIIKKAIVLGTFVLSGAVHSQNEFNVEKHQVKLDLLITPSINYEFGVSKNTTVGIGLGVTGFSFEDNNNEKQYAALIGITADNRYYYNLQKRKSKDKNISNNSGNFIALKGAYVPKNFVITNAQKIANYGAFIGSAWGFQRTYIKHLNIGLDLGMAYAFSNIEHGVIPIIDFNLGWVF